MNSINNSITNLPHAVDPANQPITTGNPVTDAYNNLSKAQSELAQAQQQKIQAQSQIDNECFQQFEDISDKSHDIRQKEYDIADGGLEDWSQKLSNNRKERMLTSGIGIELLFNLLGL